MLFPTDEQNCLGLIYDQRDDGRRIDMGSLCIKGNGSCVQVCPRLGTPCGSSATSTA